MISSFILAITGLTALAQASTVPNRTITCGAPLCTGSLWYGNYTRTGSYEGQIGVLSHLGAAAGRLWKYPNPDIDAITVQVVPCDSTYLGAVRGVTVSNDAFQPVKLQLGGGKCLGLEKDGTSDTFITSQTCVDGDDESQHPQFWTMDPDYGTLFPVYTPGWPRVAWNNPWGVQFVNEAVITNAGGNCSGCSDGEKYSFLVQES
jgi:hypothetical protein